MLTKIIYSYFSLGNLTALAKKIHLYLAAKFPDHSMITTVLVNLKNSLNTSVQAAGSSTKQTLTKSVRDADKKRDNSYISLKDHIHAGLRRENETYRLACEALWAVFEKNGTQLYNMPDGSESTAIDSLLRDLDQSKAVGYLETVNAVEWLQELDRDNENFIAISQQRSSERSVDETETDDIAMDQLRISLELVSNVMSALLAMNDPKGIQEAVNEVNQYIREANASAKLGKPHPAPEEAEKAEAK